MKAQAFDSKNKDDFDKYTEALNKALASIASDRKLDATVALLSKLTGIHRNTIRNRQWPLQRLESIKDQRRLEDISRLRKKEKKQDPVSILSEKLEKSRLEVVYWFNQFRDAEHTSRSYERRLNDLRGSRDKYLQLAESRLVEVNNLRSDIEKLREVISILESDRRPEAAQ